MHCVGSWALHLQSGRVKLDASEMRGWGRCSALSRHWRKVGVSRAIIQGECRLLLDVVIGKGTACVVEKLTWRKEAVSQPGIQEECQASTPSGTVLSISPTVEGFYSAMQGTMILKPIQAHRDAEAT